MGGDGDPGLRRARARVGHTLRDKWRLDKLIGVGGMAAVYAATHRNGLRGAVKMLHLELSLDPDVRERFLREGYAANRVDHPGVVRVLDDDVAADGSIFLVMELLDGQTVEARASASGGILAAAEVFTITDATLDVLAAAHDKGIVHRDIKPENLFLTRAGDVKLLDFGLARLREGSSRATSTGAAMGTPAFMPPEQAAGRWDLVDARTDLWALGATMFTLLTGRLVHEAATVPLTLAASITKPARPLSSVWREAPPRVATVVDRALAFEVTARWPNAAAMQADLRGAREAFALAPRFSPQLDARDPSLPDGAQPPLRPLIDNSVRGTTSPVSSVAVTRKVSRKSSLSAAAAVALGLAALAATTWLITSGAGRAASTGPSNPSAAVEAELSAAPVVASVTEPAPSIAASRMIEPVGEPPASAPSAQASAPIKKPAGRGRVPTAPARPKHEGIF